MSNSVILAEVRFGPNGYPEIVLPAHVPAGIENRWRFELQLMALRIGALDDYLQVSAEREGDGSTVLKFSKKNP